MIWGNLETGKGGSLYAPGKLDLQMINERAPLLSVIVANYNNELYIRECLESILHQTYKHLEIIVSDDNSSDDSPRIIREYETKHPGKVKGVLNTVNRGVAYTRHEAILQAKSQYITTLDSDDYYYHNQKLEKEMELVLNYKEKTGKDIIAYSNIVMVKGDKTLICLRGNPGNIKEGKIFNDIIARACMIPRDFIMKKEAYFEVGGYDFSFPIYEDWDLKIRLAHKYEFYYTGLKGTGYRRHGQGLSAAPPGEHIKYLNLIFQKNLFLSRVQDRESAALSFQKIIHQLQGSG